MPEKPSLASQIDGLFDTAPTDWDPEALEASGTADASSFLDYGDDPDGADIAAGGDGRLAMRGGLDDGLDPDAPGGKYSGQRLARKDYEQSEDEEEDDEEGDDDDSDEHDAAGGDSQSKRGDFVDSDEDESFFGAKKGQGGADSSSGSDEEEDDDEDEDEEEEDAESSQEEDSGSEDDDDEQDDNGAGEQGGTGGVRITAADDTNDVTKGQHVSTQRRLWDSCLQLRMWMQPALEAARRLPPAPTQKLLRTALANGTTTKKKKGRKRKGAKEDEEEGQAVLRQVSSGLDEVASEISGLVSDLASLRETLTQNNPDANDIAARKRRRIEEAAAAAAAAAAEDSDEDEDGDAAEEAAMLPAEGEAVVLPSHSAAEAWGRLQTQTGLLQPFLMRALDAWGKRTQAAAMGMRAVNSFKSLAKPVSEQVEELLTTNAERLTRRTQLKRMQYTVLGHADAATAAAALAEAPPEDDEEVYVNRASQHEYDVEAYDDSDMYQNLLKELVQADLTGAHGIGGSITAAEASEQRRRTKQHRKVDRAASKGRKTRYTIQEQLVNFMAPMVPTGMGGLDMMEEEGGPGGSGGSGGQRVFQGRVDLSGNLFQSQKVAA